MRKIAVKITVSILLFFLVFLYFAKLENDKTTPHAHTANNPTFQLTNPANSSAWKLILVNSNHPIPKDYEKNIVLERIGKSKNLVDKRILYYIKQMLKDAKQDGIDLLICSAYRPRKRQAELFEARVRQEMKSVKSRKEAEQAAESWIARPGQSEHNTGLALDIVTASYQKLDEGFKKTGAYEWLSSHCADYGFIERYPKEKKTITKVNAEPWHYRFVGSKAAKAIKTSGLCLEEYLEQLKQNPHKKPKPRGKFRIVTTKKPHNKPKQT